MVAATSSVGTVVVMGTSLVLEARLKTIPDHRMEKAIQVVASNSGKAANL